LLAGTLVGIALLILVGAGIYSRPRAVSAAAKEREAETLQSTSISEEYLTSNTATDKRSSKKTKQQPPPPPPAAPIIATPPAPPAPASSQSTSAPAVEPVPPDQPSQPAQPAVPPAAPKKPDNQENKDKNSKDKSKQKVVKGELIEAPQPVYPDEAKKQKIEGTVVVAIVIGHEGNVFSAKAKSGPEALCAASEHAASRARFKPSTKDGEPVNVYGFMTYNFVLDKK
jgi:TonB family protein